MFLFAEANRSEFDDYRPQVHDSNGLYLRRDGGEAVWRALHNPPVVANSYFAEANPRAFGLMQRGRDFESYQDPGARYEKRPSILIEPDGDWGNGSIRLIEIPAKLEAEDNIVAFWIPEMPFKAGDETEIRYRMRWGDLQPDANSDVAYVVETRAGQGGVSGVENEASLRKFVVDFRGGALAGMDPESKPDIIASIAGGEIVFSTVSHIAANGVWRLVIDAAVTSTEPVELRANLASDGVQLSETWLYQWRSA
jgi:glucans biosynthesis protein